MKIVVSIFVQGNFAQLKEKIKTAKLERADVVELRADSYSKISESDLDRLKKISKELKIPAIFTLRTKEEGGRYNFSFAKKLKLTEKALNLNFDYIDIELKFLEKLGKNVPYLKGNSKTKIILSYHNLKGTESLEGLRGIKKRMSALKPDVIKIAVFSRNEKMPISSSILDKVGTNQDILKLIKETKREGRHIIGIAMGKKGKTARLKALSDNYFSYFSLNEKEKTAPGQLSLTDFQKWRKKSKT